MVVSHFGSSHSLLKCQVAFALGEFCSHFYTPLRRRSQGLEHSRSARVVGDPWASTSRCAVAQVSRSRSVPKATSEQGSQFGEPPRPTTSLSCHSRPCVAFTYGSERIRGLQQCGGQDVAQCIEEGTAGGHRGPSRRLTRRMRSIRGESQEQILEGRRSFRKVRTNVASWNRS